MRNILVTFLLLCASVVAQVLPPVPVGSGVFDVARSIELYNPNPSGQIHITFDGSDPLPEDPIYMSPIMRFIPTVMKARIFIGDVGSEVVTVYVAPRDVYLAYFNCDRQESFLVDSGPQRIQGFFNSVGYNTGYINSGIEFTGVGNVNLGPINFTQTSAAFSTWIKFTAFSTGDARLIDKSSGVQEQDHVFMVSTMPVGSAQRLRFRLKTGGVTTTLTASSGDLSTNEWYHVAAVYNGVSMNLYLNGELVGSTPKTGVIDMTQDTMCMGDNPTGNRCLEAIMDEIYLYDRSLSEAEIKAHAAERDRLGIEYVSGSTVGCTADLTTDVITTFTDLNGLSLAGNQVPPNAVGWLMVDYEDDLIGLDIFPISSTPQGQWIATNIPVRDSNTYRVWTIWQKIGSCEAVAEFVKSRVMRVRSVLPSEFYSAVEEPVDPDPVDPDPTDPEDPVVDPDPDPDPVPDPVTPPVAGSFDFYVSPNGNDTNPGSFELPWATLVKAVTDAPNDSTVGVIGGNYPHLSLNSVRTGYVTLKAVEGTTPVVNSVSVGADVKVVLDGFDIFSSSRSPVLSIYSGRNFVARNCEIHAHKWAVNKVGREGVDIFDSRNITLDHCFIHEVYRGIQIRNSVNTLITRSLIRPKGSSGIQYLNNCENTVVEYCNLWAETFTPYPQDPDAFPSPHQSAISIRCGNITIRNNYIHGIGNSSGLMSYTQDAAGGMSSYDNITIENNAIYDIINVYALRFYNLGRNVVVRNNLFHAGIRDTNSGQYYRHSAVIVHSTGPTYQSGGFTFANNICIGAVYGIPGGSNFEGNVMWSYRDSSWRSSFGTNYVATSNSSIPPIFDNQTFFRNQINLNLIRTRGYVDWSLVSGTSPIGPGGRDILLGVGSLQTEKGLGTIDSDGYVLDNGKIRPAQGDVGPLQR
jgi:hypothetical protein